MQFEKCFFNIKSNYTETAIGIENSGTTFFYHQLKNCS